MISRVSGNRAPFLRAIESLPERLMLVSGEDFEMIMRAWRGGTTEANADAWELFLCEENFQAIAVFHGMSLLSSGCPGEVEFMSHYAFRRRPLPRTQLCPNGLVPCSANSKPARGITKF